MVLAAFLTKTLLEPQKRKQRAKAYAEGYAEGYSEGRAEVIAMLRSRLKERGINLDDIISLEELGISDRP